MEKKLFDELVEAIQEGGAILRGERPPARKFTYDEVRKNAAEARTRRLIKQREKKLKATEQERKGDAST